MAKKRATKKAANRLSRKAAPPPDELVMVRLPKDLVRRAESLWDSIVEDPAIRGVLPRSGTAAVRVLLERAVKALES